MATSEINIRRSRLRERSQPKLSSSSPLSSSFPLSSSPSSFFFSENSNSAESYPAMSRDFGESTSNSVESSPAMSDERFSRHSNEYTYQSAYEQVLAESADYYKTHPDRGKGYINYRFSTQKRKESDEKYIFETDQAAVIAILKELDEQLYVTPPISNQDLYYKDSPPHLKMVWDASKIICASFQSHANFADVNAHLQAFALNHHPYAPLGPEGAITNGDVKIIEPQSKTSREVLELDGAESSVDAGKRSSCTIS